jgi:hypothetical protein
MRASIQLLRREGRRLPTPGQPVEGLFETESHYVEGRTVRRVVLRNYGSAPGTGTVHALYRAAILAVDHDAVWLRGIEDAEGAAVIQEWRVVLLR